MEKIAERGGTSLTREWICQIKREGRGRETAVYIPLAALSSMSHSLSRPVERLVIAALFMVAGIAGAVVDAVVFEEAERALIWAGIGIVVAVGFTLAYLPARRWTLVFASPTATITEPPSGGSSASSREMVDFLNNVRDQLARQSAVVDQPVPPAPGPSLSAKRL